MGAGNDHDARIAAMALDSMREGTSGVNGRIVTDLGTPVCRRWLTTRYCSRCEEHGLPCRHEGQFRPERREGAIRRAVA